MSDAHDHPHEAVGRGAGPGCALSPYAARIRAIEALLPEKGVLTEAEIQDRISYMEYRSPANGARLVARAWTNPDFEALLLSDTKAAAGDSAQTPPAPWSSSPSGTRRRYTT